MNNVLTVAIIEDIPEVSKHLEEIISEDPLLTLAGRYASAEEAIEDIPGKSIDVFLVDIGLPGMNGIGFINAARQLCPNTQFVVHTICDTGKDLMAALSAGAVGYILKGSAPEEICTSLKAIAHGESILSPRMARQLIKTFSQVKQPTEVLTPRETEILTLLKKGLTYGQIADNLCISPQTVHTHIKKIYRKLKVTNRDDAVKSAVVFQLI